MALLGNLIDTRDGTRVGDALNGLTLTTLAHSLPATTPDIAIPVFRSIADITRQSALALLYFGANESLLTIGFMQGVSAASCPTISFTVTAIQFHSKIR